MKVYQVYVDGGSPQQFFAYFVKDTIVHKFMRERQLMYPTYQVSSYPCGKKTEKVIKNLAPNFFTDNTLEGISA